MNINSENIGPNDTIELINCFNSLYNNKYNKKTSMFEQVNDKDPTSTNDKMEMFYEYMKLHKELQLKNQKLIDIYDINEELQSDVYSIYALTINKKVKLISYSYISLLYYGYKEIKNDINWNILEL